MPKAPSRARSKSARAVEAARKKKAALAMEVPVPGKKPSRSPRVSKKAKKADPEDRSSGPTSGSEEQGWEEEEEAEEEGAEEEEEEDESEDGEDGKKKKKRKSIGTKQRGVSRGRAAAAPSFSMRSHTYGMSQGGFMLRPPMSKSGVADLDNLFSISVGMAAPQEAHVGRAAEMRRNLIGIAALKAMRSKDTETGRAAYSSQECVDFAVDWMEAVVRSLMQYDAESALGIPARDAVAKLEGTLVAFAADRGGWRVGERARQWIAVPGAAQTIASYYRTLGQYEMHRG
jgi:hypothetical protein